ncbi:hypothetical protein D186_23681 [Citrobacter freundii ATCC 8090 = MTCC 1658 = NBRC 12681]|uniref:hypothetical protein n=1 Tax=Citrobacter freundii TaxID=546 RepID=UPI000299B473|nr:hypothetical protein [Citrobacter freundii]EKS54281.1 hypothetical protein D186_23681 [Citrobacter freundii ATCC 8090 = MTCC 1658 = NBRC 12681]
MEVSWVIQSATMLGIGVIGYFLKTTIAEIKEQIKLNSQRVDQTEEKMEKKIVELQKELEDLRSDLPFIYVTREDFIRTMNNLDNKLDKIYDGMLKGGSGNGR